MTGKLEIKSNTFDALIVQGSETDSKSIFYVQDGQGETKFRVRGNGQVQAGRTADSAFIATEDHDLTTKKYVDNALAAADPKPAGFEFFYRSLSDSTDLEEAKSKARVSGQMTYYGANSQYYLYINRFDYYNHINISPYYDDGTTFTANYAAVEDLSVPPGAVTTAEGEHLIDYQGLGMRQFLSVYTKENDGTYSLGRIYYITGLTFYKNEPFIQAKLSTWKSLKTIYYGLNHLHLPGII